MHLNSTWLKWSFPFVTFSSCAIFNFCFEHCFPKSQLLLSHQVGFIVTSEFMVHVKVSLT
uniref:Macaca fascicularis brain cDNA, clone: QmoA-11942 n=1 Tax=Macaca fascicularis TaxID=9541 RepID=I7GN90_MACFA|nr:unnamed protein product [Macaca fascicularis]